VEGDNGEEEQEKKEEEEEEEEEEVVGEDDDAETPSEATFTRLFVASLAQGAMIDGLLDAASAFLLPSAALRARECIACVRRNRLRFFRFVFPQTV